MNNNEIQIESVIRQTEMGYTRSFIYLCYSNNHMIKTSSTVLFKQLIAEFLGATITKELGLPTPGFVILYPQKPHYRFALFT